MHHVELTFTSVCVANVKTEDDFKIILSNKLTINTINKPYCSYR